MEIFNAKKKPDKLKNALKSYLDKLDDDDYDYYGPADFYSYLLSDDSNYENIDFVFEGKEFLGVLLKSKEFGLDTVQIIGEFNGNIYKVLTEQYPDYIIFINEYVNDEPFKYYNLANMKSSLGNEEYLSCGHTSFLIPMHLDENIIRDKIEEDIHFVLNKKDLVFEDKTGSEILDELLQKYGKNQFFTGFSRSDSGHRHVAGFHYFGLDESDMRQNILTCKLNGQIIGVIKHGLYEGYGHIPHQGLAYIDVNIHYRNLGIAKLMIKELNNYLDKTLPLFLTRESDLGELCHMEKLFLENIHTTDCVSYDKQEEYYYKNKDRIPELKNYYKKITGQEIER